MDQIRSYYLSCISSIIFWYLFVFFVDLQNVQHFIHGVFGDFLRHLQHGKKAAILTFNPIGLLKRWPVPKNSASVPLSCPSKPHCDQQQKEKLKSSISCMYGCINVIELFLTVQSVRINKRLNQFENGWTWDVDSIQVPHPFLLFSCKNILDIHIFFQEFYSKQIQSQYQHLKITFDNNKM